MSNVENVKQPSNILILGSGGREHAFAHSVSKSPLCAQLFIAPGNAGTSLCGTNADVLPNDFEAVKNLVISNNIQLVIVGPEDPLVAGIVDYFAADDTLKNIPVIGPSKAGAQLEGSKAYSKDFMQRYNIPTAAYKSFGKDELYDAILFLDQFQPPYVLKADGLAAGKGVVISADKVEAVSELRSMLLDDKFGKAGSRVVIEEFMHGIEVSVFVLTDGEHYVILPEAKDYKRIGEGDLGLNTGGMGAVSPVPFASKEFMQKVEERIIIPTVNGLKKDNVSYRGFLFIGIMNVHGDPYVVEYNCRMGDPETEAVLPRINNDFVELMQAVATQQLDKIKIDINPHTAATVVMVSGGYPGDYKKGLPVEGHDQDCSCMIFHSGTKLNGDKVVTNGGRVFAVTSLAPTLGEALAKSFLTVSRIRYEGCFYRRDIGSDLMKLS